MSVDEAITPAGYPAAILKGDVVGAAFEGVQARLKALFDGRIFNHVVLPPSASRTTWEALVKDPPCVALGLGGWKASQKASSTFIGDLKFSLAVLQAMGRAADLYLGTGSLKGIGVAGIMAAIAGGLNGWTLPGVGSCRVAAITLPNTGEWFDDRSVLVAGELVFEGVKLDNRLALAELEDFVAAQAVIQVKKERGDE